LIASTITVTGVAPKWVRLSRTGSTEWSDDGLTWTEVGRVHAFDDIYMFRP
jgi:hypothetical protein